MNKTYYPERGDLIWINFDPQAGHEQMGTRPALVLSPSAYNKKVGLAIICPITSQIKGYSFEVPIPAPCRITGAILADHVKSLDWKVRNARFGCVAPKGVLEDVVAKLETILK